VLNPEVIRQSVAGLDAGPQRCAGDFYGYLFAGHPRLRGMFPPQMDGQNERLFAALCRIAELIDQPTALAQYLAQLGADHRKYGVEPEHYAAVGDALLRALRKHSPWWTDEHEESWATAYNTAAAMMVHGAEAAPGPATWSGEVVRHERRTRDLAVLSVRTDEPLPYQAGQFVTVQTGRWKRVWRTFSVANAPRRDGTSSVIDLHVRAISGGWVSTALVKDTMLNDRLLIGPAMGTMTPQAVDGRDLLCVAGGTGLAPLKALVEEVLAADEEAVARGTGWRRNIHLFHGARTPRGLYDMPELRELQRDYPWLQIIPVVSGHSQFDGARGQVVDVALGYGDWLDRESFAAGPPGMVRAAARAWPEFGYGELHHDTPDLWTGR
jgi:NAD(P)H-flavin reductase